MPSFRPRISGFLAFLTVGCGGGGTSGPPPTNSMASTGGVGQSDTVLSTLPTPLAVLVHDQNNTPVQGVSVTWTAPTGGKVNGSTSVVTPTDASGAASVTLMSATSGPPSGSLTYSVVAKDQHGNGVSGVSITWAATFGGGGVTPPTNTTGANGIASTQHQLGPADGQDTVTATSTPALQGSPVSIGALIVTAPLVDTISVGPGVMFSPGSVALKAGGTVTFKWADGPHGIHFTSGPGTLPANSANMSSGTVDYTLNNAGTYNYNCVVHGNLMTGSITVQP